MLTPARNILQLDTSAKGNHYCVSMASPSRFILLTATYRPVSTKMRREKLIALPRQRSQYSYCWQQRCRTRTRRMLHYTWVYFGNLVRHLWLSISSTQSVWLHGTPKTRKENVDIPLPREIGNKIREFQL